MLKGLARPASEAARRPELGHRLERVAWRASLPCDRLGRHVQLVWPDQGQSATRGGCGVPHDGRGNLPPPRTETRC